MRQPPPHVAPNIRKYWPIIKELLNKHEAGDFSGVRFDPEPLGQSVTTAVRRFGDTINWLVKNPEYLGFVVMDVKAWKYYHVVAEDNKVVIEPRKASADVSPLGNYGRVWIRLKPDDPDFLVQLTGLASLLAKRDLIEPISIIGQVDLKLQQQIEAKYDVAFRKEDDGTTTML